MRIAWSRGWTWLVLLAVGLFSANAFAQEGADTADALFRRGESAYAKGDKREAARQFAQFIEKFPNDQRLSEALVALGVAQQGLGDRVAAGKTFDTLIAKFPQHAYVPEAAHWLARTLLKENKPAEALATVEKALPNIGQSPLAAQLLMDQADAVSAVPERRKDSPPLYAAIATKHPQDPLAAEGLYMAAFVSLQLGANDPALKYGRDFLAAYPENRFVADVGHIVAEATLLNKQYAEAERLFAGLIEKYPKHADAPAWKVRRGVAAALQGKHAEAVAAIEPAIKEMKTPAAASEARFILAGSQIALKEYDDAAKQLEASLAAAPKGPKAAETLSLLGQVYLETKNPAKAKAALGRLVSEFPDSPLLEQGRFRLAEAAFAAGDWKTAAAEYQAVAGKWPQSQLVPQALLGLGWSCVSADDLAGAEKAFDALLARNPEEKLAIRARSARGAVRQRLGKLAPAADDFQAVAASNLPAAEKSEARYNLAVCRYGLRQFGEAVKTLQEILKDDPQTPLADKVYYDLAWAQKEQRQEKEAAESFARCAEVRPDGPMAAESLFHVGEFAYGGKDYSKAAQSYYAAMQKAGKGELGEKAAHKLAWSYYRDDKMADAQKTFAYQRATWPKGPLASDAAFLEGECLMGQKKYDEAIRVYDLVKTPTDPAFGVAARLHKAQALNRLKRWTESSRLAAEVAKEAAGTPYAIEAVYEQGVALKSLSKPAEAQALFEKVIAQSKDADEFAAKAQFMIGEIQLNRKQYDEAVKSFFKVAYGYSYPEWQSAATYEAARALEASGKRDEAVKQYRSVVEKFSKAAEAPLAADRLKTLEK